MGGNDARRLRCPYANTLLFSLLIVEAVLCVEFLTLGLSRRIFRSRLQKLRYANYFVRIRYTGAKVDFFGTK